ncbi:acyltransferase family protein [Undibacterium sp. SXout7W]|uniref:acyltransferase family protein n=1 Tax=Undibacterium sp. SXout7W TaxID=3413049 RepID=UPI003BF28ADD
MNPTPPSSKRNIPIDNIKAVLIFMVVFGHLIELHIGNDHFLRSIWIAIYAFHMPMFALVSGMFSKASLDERQIGQLVKNIVAPLIAFEVLYEVVECLLHGELSIYSGLIAPYWMLWYLLSLLSWRLLLPLFARLQFPVVLSLILALVTTYSEHIGYTLSLSRTFMFFPFFLLGWKFGSGLFLSEKKSWLLINPGIVGVAIVASFLLKSDFDYRWLYGSFSLHRLQMANLTGTAYQLLQYGLSTVIGLAVLNLLARRDWGLARIGQRSIYVFLWHGAALIAMEEFGLLNSIFQMEDTAALLLSLTSSAVIVWLCSHPRCESLTQKIILRPLTWFILRYPDNPEEQQSPVLAEKVAQQKN